MKKNLNHYITLAFIGLITVFIASCGNRKHENTNIKIKKKSDKELRLALEKQTDVSFDFMSVRIGVDFKNKSQDVSFSCYLNMRIDSAFSGSIKKASFVIGTYKVTQDSVFFADKTNKCYTIENFNYISSLFGTSIEYDFFQDLLLGLPVGFDEKTKYQQIQSKNHYILASHKEKDFKRLENDRLNIKDDMMLIQYHLNHEDLALDSITVDVPADTAKIKIKYLERKEESGFWVPEETIIEINHPSDNMFLRFNYGTVKINEPRKIKIKIPDSYIECK